MTESFLERGERNAARLGLAPAAPIEVDPALIPHVLGDNPRERTQEDVDLDTIVDGIGIVDAYNRWSGKGPIAETGKVESIMCSCPKPDHPDTHPSAWLNSQKNVWFCATCNEGGDKYDIAAWGLGFDVPGYKIGKAFPDLRRAMAEALGYTITRSATGEMSVEAATALATVTDISPQSSEPVLPRNVRINWRALFPKGTFMREWMEVCTKDDLPDEYFVWLGLMALALAAGDDVVLLDSPLIKANFMVVLYGPSGIGKTRAIRALSQVVREALPYDPENFSTGIYHVPQPGSAEALIDSFSKPIVDPTNPKAKPTGYHQVRGLLRIDELSDLMGRANRSGSVVKPTLMRFYDGYENLDTNSRQHGLSHAERPFCCTVTTTQPRAIRELLAQSDADSGFINRWIFAAGEPKKLVALGRRPLDINSVVPILQKTRTWASCKRDVELDAAAGAAWEKFFTDVIEPIRKSEDSSLLVRCDLTLKKLFLLFAINERTTVVGIDIVERVLLLWPYLRDTYGMLSGQIGLGEFEDCRISVLEFIVAWNKEHGRGPSHRDISRRAEARFSRKLVHDVIQNLIAFGEVHAPKDVANVGRFAVLGNNAA